MRKTHKKKEGGSSREKRWGNGTGGSIMGTGKGGDEGGNYEKDEGAGKYRGCAFKKNLYLFFFKGILRESEGGREKRETEKSQSPGQGGG